MTDQEKGQGNLKQEYNNASVGLNQDFSLINIKKGIWTYALNATVENFDANGVSIQNEAGNELCISFPQNFILIGTHFIPEENKHIFFITHPETGDSQIGYMENNDCTYKVLINAPCLNFNINHPIHKVVHKKTNCTTEIYWTDGYNPRRYLDINDIPKVLKSGSPLCHPEYTDDLDCNQLKLQSNFSIPFLNITDVVSGGNLIAGTYQFAIQYADAVGNPYTSYYSVTNPTPIADEFITSNNFNYPVGKSIIIDVNNLDETGYFEYFNIAVIKTINAASSVELIGTYFIDSVTKKITYTGQTVIPLAIADIFEKYPYYDIAQDVTAVQDVLVWSNLSSIERINYQNIWSGVHLLWETWRIPATENYADELNATNFKSYLRDEVYAFEGVFLLKNGKQTDSFHIPGRTINIQESGLPDIAETDADFIGTPSFYSGGIGYSPYWKIYNTASVIDYSSGYSSDSKYKGAYQYGEFAYWESTEEYPCNTELWGDLAGQKIRHHKFPDVVVSPIYESKLFSSVDSMVMGNNAIFPIGVRIDVQQLSSLINSSSLTQEQKDDIIGFKIVRGDRSTNKSIVAKGILRNVGKYTREEQDFYYPNYPYNDLREDPFLNSTNNAYAEICKVYNVNVEELGDDNTATIQYTDCNTNKITSIKKEGLEFFELCSITKPVFIGGSKGTVGVASYEEWLINKTNAVSIIVVGWEDPIEGYKEVTIAGSGDFTLKVAIDSGGPKIVSNTANDDPTILYLKTILPTTTCATASPLSPIDEDLADRQIFNSPETSFGQPFLGDILKVENVIFGTGKAHFAEVKNNAKYKLLSEDAQRKALDSSNELGAITSDFSSSAMFAAYQSYLTIYINGITRKNYAYSYNSISDYNYSAAVANALGIKQRTLDIARYLIPGVQSVDDDLVINNYQRESSVYLKTNSTLPFPDKTPSLNPAGVSLVSDKSRYTISELNNCNSPAKEADISVVSYYASIKNDVVNQWGQIYSYEVVDTGFQKSIDDISATSTIFGGDTFIGRFAFKTKLPFFIDNRVGAPDDSDIFYDEIGNIAYPKYWHSARSILKNYMSGGGLLSNLISYKAHNFDCPNDGYLNTTYSGTTTTSTTVNNPGVISTSETFTYYDGYYYLFAYGIPNFYCESSYNLDLRQATNNREGDYWNHVSSSIPDDWVQESFVSIAFDNTYNYNTTFSKQNKENSFSHLPPDWESKTCYTYFPFRAVYSDVQQSEATNKINNWLVYSPISYFDFPQNYGKLTSLDGIQNKAILARFENKSLLYNNLLTLETSNPQMAYLGNPGLFKGAPPIDFAETDLGYVGSQHKLLLKIPQGQVTLDAKRGQVFLISGTEAVELSAFGSGMNRFFTDHLAFEILRYFPTIDVDNNFKDFGLHAVYDAKFDRIIITKLDYIPLSSNIIYEDYDFYHVEIIDGVTLKNKVYLSDTNYFCNKSWTLSYNINTKSWISFHSYIPNWYIAENNFFYSGINNCCDDFDFIVATQIEDTYPCVLEATITCDILFCALEAEITCNIEPTTSTTTSSSTTLASTNCILEAEINCDTDITTSTTTSTSSTSTSTSSTSTTTTSIYPCGMLAELICNYTTTSTTTIAPCTLNAEIDCDYTTTTSTTSTSSSTTTTTTTVLDCEFGDIELNPTTTTTTTLPINTLFTLSTNSESSEWTPNTITKSGDVLHWEVTGAVNTSADSNVPTFDFSATGIKNIIVTSSDGASGFTYIGLDALGILEIDITRSTALTHIVIVNNPLLSELDVTQNTQLFDLYCYSNNLSNIDVSNAPLLYGLICDENNLTSIDVTNNIDLWEFSCSYNYIENINISNNVNLISFSCMNNNLTSIDISNNILLKYFGVSSNGITSLDLSNNPDLLQISSFNTVLSTLDISNNPLLNYLDIKQNNLTVAVVNNILDDLITFNNTNGNTFDASIQIPAITPDAGKVSDLDAIWDTVIV